MFCSGITTFQEEGESVGNYFGAKGSRRGQSPSFISLIMTTTSLRTHKYIVRSVERGLNSHGSLSRGPQGTGT